MVYLLKRLLFSRLLMRFLRRKGKFSFPVIIVWAIRRLLRSRRSILSVADMSDGETLIISRKHERV